MGKSKIQPAAAAVPPKPSTITTAEDTATRQWAIELYGARGRTMDLPPVNTHESGSGRSYRAPRGLGAAQWFADANRFGPGQGISPAQLTTRENTQATTAPGPAAQDGADMHDLALRSRADTLATVGAMQCGGEWSLAVREILPKTKSKCPMCHLLGKPADHPPSGCTTKHLDMSAQMSFRRDSANQWGYGQACYYCHLPQAICLRRNDAKGCDYSSYKDLVRGMLMLLTSYPEMHALGQETAALFNTIYELPPPAAPLKMTEQWRVPQYYQGMPMYRAFQAVAALLFLFDGRL
ncbi:unnamed protein product [Tilletia controversa]|uniref:Uncharacterized protein n=3 Tax=Tilletia TaxID=13289 RepID=A0A8X7MIK9_9BASI|nr:hypothetical protein CF328_g8976 [Tilletia controversa]KAE8181849.1 hypothetical protein CF336_g8766 [Tilletia laevis]KAE8245994.1 hypothetical protein A4X03_0g7361 [Tilletia caries]KAE8182877.1 hypothetical protein CF335_g8498 [Tilletia laevis]KAE8237310.1 hypothetical protein A4X06_0g9269 [Tilletia controversa]